MDNGPYSSQTPPVPIASAFKTTCIASIRSSHVLSISASFSLVISTEYRVARSVEQIVTGMTPCSGYQPVDKQGRTVRSVTDSNPPDHQFLPNQFYLFRN